MMLPDKYLLTKQSTDVKIKEQFIQEVCYGKK